MRIRPTLRNAALLLLAAIPGCATIDEVTALRSVAFTLERATGVRLAGVLLDGKRSWSDLNAGEIGQIVSAARGSELPLELVLHVHALNPAENRVTARLVEMDWTLFVEDHRMLDGRIDDPIAFPPGTPVDVPLGVRFDLLRLQKGGAQELLELALSIAGASPTPRELRLEAKPTIETALGPIRYPGTIVLRRTVGGE